MSCNCACYTISANFGVQSYVTLLILSLILYKQAPVNETSALYGTFPVMIPQAMRLFVGEPVWTPYNRPHDHLLARYDPVSEP